MIYRPNILLRNGHLNTIYPTLFRRQKWPSYSRERFTTPDDDFLDVDFLKDNNNRLAVLCHGLEGSSSSNYIQGLAALLHEKAWDIAALNYRSCSGEMNRQLRMYHSGATSDLHFLVNRFVNNYSTLVLAGFSLGGNLIMKYAGENPGRIPSQVKALAAVSVPTDLEAGSINIGTPSNFIYELKFLYSLKRKMRLKAQIVKEVPGIENLSKVRSLYDFDNYFTAPIHGFRDAHDYYSQCSSNKFIESIKLPCLLLNAKDDPFLPASCYPEKLCASNPFMQYETPDFGGHVGFVETGKRYYWSEYRIESFLKDFK